MGINKVVYGTVAIIDISDSTIREDRMMEGDVGYGADGERVIGTFTLDEPLSEQDILIGQIREALQGKASGGTVAPPIPTQEKTVEITENGTVEITPDEGYVLSKVTANVSVESGSTTPQYQELYQRVEYIESAVEGTYPYFMTDFVADNNCGLEVIASFPTLQDRIPMGSRLDSNATRFYCIYPLSANSVYYGFNTGVTISAGLKVNTIYRLQTNFLNSRLANVYEENGTRRASGSINATLTPHTVPVSIFGYHSASSNTVTSKREFKLYLARCSRMYEVVRKYVPCYRKSDGVVGLHEEFTDTFLTPIDGTFKAGPEIDW